LRIKKQETRLTLHENDDDDNDNIKYQNRITEHSKGNKTVPEKVATTCTEDGHRHSTKTSTAIYTVYAVYTVYGLDWAGPG